MKLTDPETKRHRFDAPPPTHTHKRYPIKRLDPLIESWNKP